jgi:hypothetical protein
MGGTRRLEMGIEFGCGMWVDTPSHLRFGYYTVQGIDLSIEFDSGSLILFEWIKKARNKAEARLKYHLNCLMFE